MPKAEVPDPKEEKRAPYWQELIDLSVPRNHEGDLTRTHSWSGKTRDCRVMEVSNHIHLRLPHPGDIIAASTFNPGDVIVRKGRRANDAEIAMAKALTLLEIERVEIGVSFSDHNALFTALRTFGRNIQESILGVSESVFGNNIELPGQIHRLLDEASKKEALDKAAGIMLTALELMRIIGKTQGGFKSAWYTLAGIQKDATAGNLDSDQISRRVENVVTYLRRISRLNPFFTWGESGIRELKKETPDIPAAMARIKKGWQGETVSQTELKQIRNRILEPRKGDEP